MTDYHNLSSEEFDSILRDIVIENAATLLTITGAYEVFSEHFNNEVLERYENDRANDTEIEIQETQVDKAFWHYLCRRFQKNPSDVFQLTLSVRSVEAETYFYEDPEPKS